jgi:hypothetical protein
VVYFKRNLAIGQDRKTMDIPKPAPPLKKLSKETVVFLDEIHELTDAVLEEARIVEVSLMKEVNPKYGVYPIEESVVNPVKKKPFITREHLTQKAFSDNDNLQELKKQLKFKENKDEQGN